ncbi:hypothetical protein [Deinococcus sp. 12RED42]|uniref:hypothetical protein n=1 Tax=Deinococcus sp. 12RED42 TaxID=2745872 RepID=UPI001E5F0AF4|nr:hypothetical protein [Deinococcus sp. 12RED42]MCD0164413.1 hypothetical protein [Deinococcus sp. 12RED42]
MNKHRNNKAPLAYSRAVSIVSVSLLLTITDASAYSRWDVVEYWQRRNDLDQSKLNKPILKSEEIISSLSSGSVKFVGAEDVYMEAPKGFSTAVSAPVILYNGKAVGVAFEETYSSSMEYRSSNKKDNYIICGDEKVYISAEYYKEIAKKSGIDIDIRFDSAYSSLNIRFGREQRIFKGVLNASTTARYCLNQHQSNMYKINRYWKDAKTILGESYFEDDGDEDYYQPEIYGDRQLSDQSIMLSVLVDGQWYVKIDGCPTSSGCLPTDKDIFKLVDSNNRKVTKFINIEGENYIHEDFWNQYIDFDSKEVGYSVRDQSYVYTGYGDFDAKYIMKSFPLPNNPLKYSMAALKKEWDNNRMRVYINKWKAINGKSVLVDGAVVFPESMLDATNIKIKDRKLYLNGVYISKQYDPKIGFGFYVIKNEVYFPVSTLLNLKIVGKGSNKDTINILGPDGISAPLQINKSNLPKYSSSELLKAYNAEIYQEKLEKER